MRFNYKQYRSEVTGRFKKTGRFVEIYSLPVPLHLSQVLSVRPSRPEPSQRVQVLVSMIFFRCEEG